MPTSNPTPVEDDRPPEGLSFELPDVIADHTLLRCIGEGSYGKVYLACNQLTGVYRAVKVVFRHAFRDSRPYLREFDAICRFEPVSRSHQGFVQILHVGRLENAFYYIMEIADDCQAGTVIHSETYTPRTLGQTRGQILPIEQCIEIGSRLADCLAVLHEKSLIHRDIKPSNIIFVNGQPKLADIGLVTQIDEAKSFVGTAGFMPPEGPVSPASDIFSLGKVLYEISTGKDRCEFPQLPSDISSDNALHLELNQIILRACHPRPEKRYRTAQDLRRELDLLHTGKSIKRLRQVEKRLRVVKFAFAAFVVLGLASFMVYYRVKASREAAERERQRRAGYLLAEGTSEMRNGYLAHALPYFVRAAEYDPTDLRSHRLRIGSVKAQAPRLVHHWNSAGNGDLSPDGRRLIAPEGNSVRIFDSLSGKCLQTNLLPAPVSFARFSLDQSSIAAAMGNTLAVLSSDGQKEAQHEFQFKIHDLSFSPSDGRVAVALTNGSAFFFDPKSAKADSFPPGGMVKTISFDSRGDRMITSDDEGNSSYLRDADTAQILGPKIVTDMPYRGVFSPDGSFVVVCGWTSAVPFMAVSGALGGDTMDNDDAVVHAAFSPGANILATANYDGTVRFWDASSFDPLPLNHVLPHDSRPERVAFIDEHTLVVHCHDGQNFVWNLGSKAPPATVIPSFAPPDLLHIHQDGATLSAQGDRITGTLGGKSISVKFPSAVSTLAVSPRNDAFAAGSKDPEFEVTYALLYRLPDVARPVRLNHKDGINHIAFSHSGQMLVTSSEDFSAIIWSARDGRRLTEAMRHRWQVMWAAFSADDNWVVTAGWDKMCVVWNATTGDPLTAPLRFPEFLYFVDFEPGDNGIIAAGKDAAYRMDLPFAELPLKLAETGLRDPFEITIPD